MYYPSFSVISSCSLFIYLAYVFYNFWALVQPPDCQEEKLCIYSYLDRNPKFQVSI